MLGEVNIPSACKRSLQGSGSWTYYASWRPQGAGVRDVGDAGTGRQKSHGSVRCLMYQPANNVWVHPGDTIYVYREPQVFLAFGAAGQQGQFPFDMWKISLAQAMAKAGGLLDAQAEPSGVYRLSARTA